MTRICNTTNGSFLKGSERNIGEQTTGCGYFFSKFIFLKKRLQPTIRPIPMSRVLSLLILHDKLNEYFYRRKHMLCYFISTKINGTYKGCVFMVI
jgi:hypothetical protein